LSSFVFSTEPLFGAPRRRGSRWAQPDRRVSRHGLRKAGATIAAENGATAHQLMSIFGRSTLKQAEIYTKAAQQKLLAASGMSLIVPGT